MSDYEEDWSELAKENTQLMDALRDLYWQLYGRPAKHPQQLEQRKRAAALLGISTQPGDPIPLALEGEPSPYGRT